MAPNASDRAPSQHFLRDISSGCENFRVKKRAVSLAPVRIILYPKRTRM
jgi:hypothetical protein